VGGAEQGGRWPIWPEESPSCAEQGARCKPGQRWPVTLTVQIGTQHLCCVRATETMTGLCPGGKGQSSPQQSPSGPLGGGSPRPEDESSR